MLKKLARRLFPPRTSWKGQLMHVVDDNGKLLKWGMVAFRDNPHSIMMLEFPIEGGVSLPQKNKGKKGEKCNE